MIKFFVEVINFSILKTPILLNTCLDLYYKNHCDSQFDMESYHYFRFPCSSSFITQVSYFPAPLDSVYPATA